ncbi:DUF418 domain-containing protein [Lipingzhangella sp. LS1_29]|uniref:DUF418 domain-containing protein n=1 Tax=Lipingzhangella rawalii TaxID=2055835 RepID=A0ABU2H4P7_9ACTN|nr:DUF418 domain-containing protein [Lipingzhangella rawalii]MDS1270282.1 DUF418 domain-containing protein [Lipingzhangella rawalii]
MTSETRNELGPKPETQREIAPDLARGLMLLLISIANAPIYLLGRDASGTNFHPTEGSTLDLVVQGVVITTVDMRVYPMFAFLFGYGMVQMLRRQQEKGVSEQAARRALRRRNLWLFVFGFFHAALLFAGDILGAYALSGLVLAWLFLRRSGRTQLVWAALGMALLTVSAVFSIWVAYRTSTGQTAEGFAIFDAYLRILEQTVEDPNYLSSVVFRASIWPTAVLVTGLLSLSAPIAILLAFWAANRRILEDARDHQPLLRTVAIGGITIGWLGGLPHALAHTGQWQGPENTMWVFSTTHPLTGLACGLGYVALFGLIAQRIRERATITTALTAVGKRSLSCYLAQSVIAAPLLAAWGLGVGAHLNSAGMTLVAVAIWALTVVGAYVLERQERRGPAEVVLRRLTYRAGITRMHS